MTLTLQDWTNWDKRCDALGKLDQVALVTLCVDWARSVLPIFEKDYPDDNRPRLSIEVTEKWLKDGDATPLLDVASNAREAGHNKDGRKGHCFWAAGAASYVARTAYGNNEIYYASSCAASTAWATAWYAANRNQQMKALFIKQLGDVFKKPWDAVIAVNNRQFTYETYLAALPPKDRTWDDSWLSPTVQLLAQADHPELPIIADALEEVGCTNKSALEHLRTTDFFTRADWVWRQLTKRCLGAK